MESSGLGHRLAPVGSGLVPGARRTSPPPPVPSTHMMPRSGSDFPIPKMRRRGPAVAQPWHGARPGAHEAQPRSPPGPAAACRARHPRPPLCSQTQQGRAKIRGHRTRGQPRAAPQEPRTRSIQEAAGTLAGPRRRHGSGPAAWEERRAAEGPPQHDPPTSTVYEAGTQYAGPASAETPLPMSRHETSPTTVQPASNHRPNACCFCWCCCCSCSWNEDRERAWRASRETKLETIPNCEACAKPTPEEVRGWAQSFDKLMKSPAGRNVFREFLRTEYSEENMLFWLACEELKTECNKHTIDEKARMIYEDYISILSPKEVSLDSRVREVINRKMQEPSSHTFDDAQLQIYTLMHRDSYPRFLNSAIYKSLLQSVSRSSSES
uniref:Regulator of G-protein signaling 20 n=1 Tax=Anser cygnoides TaxID=8845 RepID=A0A8B9EDT0_ANSCY